jgi:putative MFS transporter
MLILAFTALIGLIVTMLLGRNLEPGNRSLEEISETDPEAALQPAA